jgi:hypothetical protein
MATVTIERDLPNPYDGKRIYAVVAESVFHPIKYEEIAENILLNNKSVIGPGSPFKVPKFTEETRIIRQVPGRMAAQAAHAVSKVRHFMLRSEVLRAERVASKSKSKERWFKSDMLFFHPITTIILSCRDSFELHHVKQLFNKYVAANYEVFKDTNPEVYGEGEVITALATHPVAPGEVAGILDYLPLWTPCK